MGRPSRQTWTQRPDPTGLGTKVTPKAPEFGEHGEMSQQAAPTRKPRNAALGVVQQVSVTSEGRMVAWATVGLRTDNQVFANVHVEPGHLPPGTREMLIDRLMMVVSSLTLRHLELVLPMGDGELLGALNQQCDRVAVRPAGATCLVSADVGASSLGPGDGPRPEQPGFTHP
jgi:hypothetical protein